MFADRTEAAERVAEALRHHQDQHPLVFAFPCRAVPMAAVLACRLSGELDVVTVRKLPDLPRAAGWSGRMPALRPRRGCR